LSLLHGGPAPTCLASFAYDVLTATLDDVADAPVHIEDVCNSDVKDALQKVM